MVDVSLAQMNVAIYTRVSTDAQGEDGKYGLPTQEADAKDFCNRSGFNVVKTYEDNGYSGAIMERPGLKQMLLDAQSGAFQAVVVARGDRLARDINLNGSIRWTLQEAKVQVLSATEITPAGTDPMMASMFQGFSAMMAMYEKGLIKNRLLGGRRVKKARGGFIGGQVPFGKRLDGKGGLTDEPVELKTISVITDWFSRGFSLNQIARNLNHFAYAKTKQGKAWTMGSVRSVLRSTCGYTPKGAKKKKKSCVLPISAQAHEIPL